MLHKVSKLQKKKVNCLPITDYRNVYPSLKSKKNTQGMDSTMAQQVCFCFKNKHLRHKTDDLDKVQNSQWKLSYHDRAWTLVCAHTYSISLPFLSFSLPPFSSHTQIIFLNSVMKFKGNSIILRSSPRKPVADNNPSNYRWEFVSLPKNQSGERGKEKGGKEGGDALYKGSSLES